MSLLGGKMSIELNRQGETQVFRQKKNKVNTPCGADTGRKKG